VEHVAQGIWRPVLGRLQLLLHAVPLYGIQPPSRTGFPSDALMNFVTQAFNSPNGEVRNAAIKVTTEVYRLMGPSVEKYLKGIKPLIKEVPFAPLRLSSGYMEGRNRIDLGWTLWKRLACDLFLSPRF